MAKKEASKKIILGSVACALALITVVFSAIGIFIHNKTTEPPVDLGVGEVLEEYSNEKWKAFSKSSDESIATVEDGVVTAVGTGECLITIGRTEFTVTVYNAPEKVDFPTKELTLGAGEEFANPAISGELEYIPKNLYKSSDEAVAKIDESGKITAVGVGEAIITASTYNDLKSECKITVKKAPEKVWFANECKELIVGKKFNLNPRIEDDAYSSVMTVTSSDESIIKALDDGRIEAVKEGTATITATTFNGVTATCEIKVVLPPPPPETTKPNGKPVSGTQPYTPPSGDVTYAECIRKDLDPSKPMIALSFDDGPNASTTNRILDVLEQNNCSATFFIVGNRAKSGANKTAVQRMVQMGCQLGNHTYDHEHYGKSVTAADIGNCNEAIRSATGYYPSAFRPTGGELSDTIRKNAGLPIYIWSLDTLDWKSRNADSVYSKIMNNAKDGDIVLMHDIYKSTASAVERAVPELVKKGFQIVNIAELQYYKGDAPENGKVYYSFK